MSDNEIRVVITGVASDLRRALDSAKGDLGGLKAAIRDVPNRIKIDVDAQTAVADEKLRRLRDAAHDVPNRINIEADADTGTAMGKLALLRAFARDTAGSIGGAFGGGGGGGGGGGAFSASNLLPFGPSASVGGGAIAAGSPAIAAGVGAATAVAGSAGAAALGAGALGTSALGALAAGIGPLMLFSGGLKDAVKLSGQLDAAQQKLTATQHLYGAGSKQAASAQKALNLIVAEADPAVLKFAQSWGKLTETIDAAEQKILPAFASALRPVLSMVTNLLPTIERMARIDLRGLSIGLKPVLDFMNSAAFKGALLDLSRTFAQLAGPLGQAFTNLMRAFLSVATAASPFLVQIAKAFADWTASFAKALAPGQHLNDLIGGLVSQLQSWWDLAKSVGDIMITIFSAGASTGQSLVNMLTGLLKQWNAWLNTKAGQQALMTFFRDSKDLIVALFNAFGPLAGALVKLIVDLMPAVTGLLKALTPLFDGLAAVISKVADSIQHGLVSDVLQLWFKAVRLAIQPTLIAFGLMKGAVEALARAFSAAWQWMETAFKNGLSFLLGGLSTMLGVIKSVVDAVNIDIPGIGHIFGSTLTGVSRDLGNAQSSIDDFRKGLNPAKSAVATANTEIARSYDRMAGKISDSIDTIMHKVNAWEVQAKNFTAVWPSQAQTIIGAYKSIDIHGSAALDDFHAAVRSNMDYIASHTVAKSQQAKDAIALNFATAATFMNDNYNAMGLATALAMKEINRLLREELKALGVTKVPGGIDNNQLNFVAHNITGGVGSAGSNLSPTSPALKSGGGLVGRWGEKGHDTVPALLGEGEAVLNHSQQRVVNAALQRSGIGGLPEVFSKVTTPHYMATGGYVYPFGNLSPGRIDQGYDLSGAGPIGAIGPGVVLRNTEWGGWPGDGGIVYRLTAGPRAGSNVYVMEDFHAGVPVNATVSAGQVIGTAWGGPSAIESGWANSAGTGPLTPYNGAADGTPMPGGIDFRNFVNGLAHGKLVGGGSLGGALGIAPQWKNVKTPAWKGPGGALGAIGQGALAKATAAANAFGRAHVGSSGVGGISAAAFAGQGGSADANRALAHKMMLAAGWPESQWPSLLALWNQESGFSSTAQNPSSGAAGIPQDITGNFHGGAAGQIAWGLNYIRGRYGSPSAAEAHEQAFNWYAKGGYVQRFAGGGNVWRVPFSQEDASSGSGWTELSTNGNAAAKSGHPHTATHQGGWDFATLGRMYPKGTSLNIRALSGRSGTFPLTDFGDGSSFAPAIGLTPNVQGRLGVSTGVVDISMADGSNINLASGFGRLVSGTRGGTSSSTTAAKNPKAPPFKPSPVPKLPLGFKIPAPLDAAIPHITYPYASWGGRARGRPVTTYTQPKFDTLLATLGSLLDPATGEVADLSDRIQVTSQIDDQLNSEYATSHPGVDTNTGLQAGAAAGDPASVDKTYVGRRVAQLTQLYKWQAKIRSDLQRAVNLIGPLLKALNAAIASRQAEIKRIQRKVKDNMELLGLLRVLLRIQAHSRHPSRAAISQWTADSTAISNQNVALAGSASSVGTGGILGTLTGQITELQDRVSTVTGDQLTLTGPSGIGGTLGAAKLEQQTLADQLKVFSPGALSAAVSAANANLASTAATGAAAAGPDLSALNALQAQQLTATQQALALSQSQFGTLSGFLPLLQGRLVGSFASGIDYVPHTGLALVHRGETITPDPGGPFGNRAATVHTAAGPVEVHLHFEGDAGTLVKLIDARMNDSSHGALRVVSDQSGQKARLMAGVRRP